MLCFDNFFLFSFFVVTSEMWMMTYLAYDEGNRIVEKITKSSKLKWSPWHCLLFALWSWVFYISLKPQFSLKWAHSSYVIGLLGGLNEKKCWILGHRMCSIKLLLHPIYKHHLILKKFIESGYFLYVINYQCTFWKRIHFLKKVGICSLDF